MMVRGVRRVLAACGLVVGSLLILGAPAHALQGASVANSGYCIPNGDQVTPSPGQLGVVYGTATILILPTGEYKAVGGIYGTPPNSQWNAAYSCWVRQ